MAKRKTAKEKAEDQLRAYWEEDRDRHNAMADYATENELVITKTPRLPVPELNPDGSYKETE